MRTNSFVTSEMIQNDLVVLSPEESHHLARVLRVEAGQEITLFAGEGTRAEGIVETVTKKEVTVRILSRETVPPPAVEITLIQSVCKPDRFEMILQKATELGVRTIQPVITQNASLPAGKIDKMISRGEAIIRNAAQQCGTAWLPKFHRLQRISDLFPTLGKSRQTLPQSVPPLGKNRQAPTQLVPRFGNFDVAFIGSLHPNAVPFKKAFEELRRGCGSPGRFALPKNIDRNGGNALAVVTNAKFALPKNIDRNGGANRPGEPNVRVALLIGPEGDFTEEEINAAVKAGAIPVTFGKQILRTETAAIFGLSVLAYELL